MSATHARRIILPRPNDSAVATSRGGKQKRDKSYAVQTIYTPFLWG